MRADVLIVEDDTDCREILHDILVHAGHVVSVAIDRREALEQIEHGRAPTLIIMDLMMPNLDMPTFQQRLDELGLGDVPFIAISAANEREVKTPRGSRARFIKPIDLSGLLSTVDQILEERAATTSIDLD
jgi:CheY-like chemotaxis protein